MTRIKAEPPQTRIKRKLLRSAIKHKRHMIAPRYIALARNAWHSIKNNSEQIKILFALSAGIFAVTQYIEKDRIDKIGNSFKEIESFYNSDYQKSILKLEGFWIPKVTKYAEDINNISDTINTAHLTIEKNKFRESILISIRSKYSTDMRDALRGLRSLSLCGIQGRCDRDTICAHMAITMQDIRCNYREYIEERSRHASSCIIDEINYFVDRYCHEWIAEYLGLQKYTGLKDNYCLYNSSTGKYLFGELCGKPTVYEKRHIF